MNNQLLVSNGRYYKSVWTDEILFITFDQGYAVITLQSKEKIVTTKNLKELEKVLSKTQFLRINHGVIINRNHILTVRNQNANIVTMRNAEQFQISTRKKKTFFESFMRI